MDFAWALPNAVEWIGAMQAPCAMRDSCKIAQHLRTCSWSIEKNTTLSWTNASCTIDILHQIKIVGVSTCDPVVALGALWAVEAASASVASFSEASSRGQSRQPWDHWSDPWKFYHRPLLQDVFLNRIKQWTKWNWVVLEVIVLDRPTVILAFWTRSRDLLPSAIC